MTRYPEKFLYSFILLSLSQGDPNPYSLQNHDTKLIGYDLLWSREILRVRLVLAKRNLQKDKMSKYYIPSNIFKEKNMFFYLFPCLSIHTISLNFGQLYV